MSDLEHGLLLKFKKIFKRKLHPVPLNVSMVNLMEYGYRYNYLVHNDTNKMYPKNEWVIKRIIWIIFCRLMMVLLILRVLIMINYNNNETIRMILSDFAFKMNHGSKFALIMIATFVSALSLLISFQYMEMSDNCPGMRLIHLISTEKLTFKLSYIDEKWLTLIVHLMTKYVIRQVHGVLMAVTLIIYLYLTLISYFDPESGLTLFLIIFWCFPIYIAFQQMYGRFFAQKLSDDLETILVYPPIFHNLIAMDK